MGKINKGRMTAVTDEGIVVFLIGMRINNVLAFHKWVPVFMAMARMLPELYKNPQLGFKSYQMWFSRTLILVQYWESAEKLLHYAKATDSEHLPAWKAFNKAARASDAVGIWHETYVVPKGAVENMYVNMPSFGFGKVGELVPATGKRNSARDRLGES
ncbi:MAG: DUF4188 domain-containing protein [Actinobacteria bacterium]|uniref:Unannotated protein n=1 Tax=freshwater metagenome TaxID=449393 RepID=A0A6J6NB03_9ZZZZ|nr:DUF4188 domain-containing protein [Actinomycetota bacterium]